jgi:plasmid stability protein
MSTTVTLTLPDDLYARLQRRASDTQRSLADEAIEAMAMALPTVDDLPQPIARELAALADLDDDRLWQAAQRTLTRRDDRRLRALTRRQQETPLTIAEEQELDELLDRLDDVGLIRARAAVLLKERGHDVSALLPAQA